MQNKRKKYLLVVLLLLVTLISVGYAALTSTLNLNGNSTIKKAKWDIHFENLVKQQGSTSADIEAALDETNTAVNYTVTLKNPGDFYEFTVDVVNNGTIDAMLSETLNAGLTTNQAKYIDYKVTYYDDIEFNEKDILKAGTKDTLKVRVKYKNDINPADLPTTSESVTLTFQVTYIQDDGTGKERDSKSLLKKISKQAVPDNIASTYVTSDTGIDFSQISSDTNGKGVYLLASTKNYINPVYYYRGAVKNNNLKFAGFCWKIVRTTETGGVKLIYNGTPDSNGYCTNTTGSNTRIWTKKSEYTDNAYVGYMYGTPASSTYEETHKNTNDSIMKTAIDDWYQTNMTAYTEKLEDTIWCNDRSLNSGTGIGIEKTNYGAYGRLTNEKAPSLNCQQGNDKFTVSKENGNGALTYPVALLTADEAAYAGGIWSYSGTSTEANTSYYLYTNEICWLLSPYTLYYRQTPGLPIIESSMFTIGETGALMGYRMDSVNAARPSISLKPNTAITTGDGTANNPYVVE